MNTPLCNSKRQEYFLNHNTAPVSHSALPRIHSSLMSSRASHLCSQRLTFLEVCWPQNPEAAPGHWAWLARRAWVCVWGGPHLAGLNPLHPWPGGDGQTERGLWGWRCPGWRAAFISCPNLGVPQRRKMPFTPVISSWNFFYKELLSSTLWLLYIYWYYWILESDVLVLKITVWNFWRSLFTTAWIQITLLNYTLKNDKCGTFFTFYQNFKKWTRILAILLEARYCFLYLETTHSLTFFLWKQCLGYFSKVFYGCFF